MRDTHEDATLVLDVCVVEGAALEAVPVSLLDDSSEDPESALCARRFCMSRASGGRCA